MEQDDEMSFLDQPCKEVAIFDIFSPDIIAGVKDLYFPIFKDIRIYGSIEDPLFVAKDVQDALGLKDMNYKRDGLWEWDKEKVKIKIQTAGGAQPVIALTEQGLYKSIFHSKVEMALKFQTFITCVMKRLRIHGKVTMDQALADFHIEIAKLKSTIKAYDIQMEVEHKELVHYKSEHDNIVMGNHDVTVALWKAKQRLEHARDPNISELQDRLQRVLERTGRSIYVMLNEVPEMHKETYTYNIEEYSDGDADIVDQSEDMIFSIGLTALKTKVTMKRVFVHKSVKLEDIHAALHRYRLDKFDKKGDPAGHYTNMYTISLDQLDIVIDDVNRKDEDEHRED